MAVTQPVKRGRREWPALAGLLLVAVLAAGIAISSGLWIERPSDEVVTPAPAERPSLVTGGTTCSTPAAIVEGEILIPVDVVRETLDPSALWDESLEMLILTTRDRVVKMRTGELTSFVNDKPVVLPISPQIIDGIPYVPAEAVSGLLGFTISRDANLNTVTIDPAGSVFQTATVTEATHIRTEPSIKAPSVSEVSPGETVYLFGETNNWYAARLGAGLPGYIPKDSASLKEIMRLPEPAVEHYRAWKRTGEQVFLTWEHVFNVNPRPSSIGQMPGLNVISPTWLRLADESGLITCRADPAYVDWAHKRGYEVWALVDNNFDPALTTRFLGNPAARENAIRSILVYAKMYRFDGINVDFENMEQSDSRAFVQFIREMAPLAHEHGLTVSVDVTVKSNSPNWSLCYDRKGLGQAADFVILMAYDEHSSGSRIAGPVASLPWVEKGIRGILEDVEPSKVVLGIPFYTRLWKTGGNGTHPTSRALSMDSASALVKEKRLEPQWDDTLKLNVVRYSEDGYEYSMWLEDPRSIEHRLGLVKRYGLRGIAAWRRGFENSATWAEIARLIRP